MSPVPERNKQTLRHTGGGPRVDSVAGPNEFYRFRSTRPLCFIVLFPIHVSPHIIHTSCAVSRVNSPKAHTKEPPCGSFNTYILSIRVFVRKVKISFHLLFSCDKVFLSIFRKHRKRYFLHHKKQRPHACHAQSLLLRFSGSKRREAAVPSQSTTYPRRFLGSSEVRSLVSFC